MKFLSRELFDFARIYMLFDLRNNVSVARNNPVHSMTIKFVDIVRRLYDDQVVNDFYSFLVGVKGSPVQ